MTAALPLGFWLCLAGATVGGGLVLWVLARALLRAGSWRRLRALARAEGATTVVEFPFALLVLVQVTLFTWQVGLMAAAYLVMDYAAFAAVRAAVVIVPESTDGNPAEGPGHVNSSDCTAWTDLLGHAPQVGGQIRTSKGTEIRQAAVFACYPISGVYRTQHIDLASAMDALMLADVPPDYMGLKSVVAPLLERGLGGALEGARSVESMLPPEADYVNRYGYAWLNTTVRIQPDVPRAQVTIGSLFGSDALDEAKAYLEDFSPDGTWDWWDKAVFETIPLQIQEGETLTVEVALEFQCAVPYAGAVLSGWRRKQGIGWCVTLQTRASMLYEGYAEEKPEGAGG